MGSGFTRRKKMFEAQQTVQQLHQQLQEVVMDPEGAFQKMAAPLIQQVEKSKLSESRLSALVCALLLAQGGKAIITRGTIEQFREMRVSIMTETSAEDDGKNLDEPITFSYKAEPIEASNPEASPVTPSVPSDEQPVSSTVQ
jgi:hypothetical protein